MLRQNRKRGQEKALASRTMLAEHRRRNGGIRTAMREETRGRKSEEEQNVATASAYLCTNAR